MTKLSVFDEPHSQSYAQARMEFLREILPGLKEALGLRTALDVGCGVGYFSNLLHDLGFHTVGVDARSENVTEASRRHPHIRFLPVNVEDPGVSQLGSFDLVLCFGLLYHLENPLLALRNISLVTGKLLLLESMRAPSGNPVLVICDEEPGDDQSLKQIALYPSEAGIAKMLYRAGFRCAFRFVRFPEHEEFRTKFMRKRVRTLLAASRVPVMAPFLVWVPEPAHPPDLWATPPARVISLAGRAWGALRKPWPDKMAALRRRFHAD